MRLEDPLEEKHQISVQSFDLQFPEFCMDALKLKEKEDCELVQINNKWHLKRYTRSTFWRTDFIIQYLQGVEIGLKLAFDSVRGIHSS